MKADRDRPLTGKTWLVTGGTTGIGAELVRGLAGLGAEVVFVGRSGVRAAALVDRLGTERPDARVCFLAADILDQAQIRRLAHQVTERWPKLDGLINNAGAIFGQRRTSADGIECTLALNHLAPFLLTRLLVPVLAAAGTAAEPARVIVVASNAHRGGRIDREDLERAGRYHGWRAYQQSKLANLLFTFELARRLASLPVVVNAAHPGLVATDIGVANGMLSGAVWWLVKQFALTPAAGAAAVLAAVTDLKTGPETGPEAGRSGRYFVRGCPADPAPAARDADTARWLWDWSERRLGLSPFAPPSLT